MRRVSSRQRLVSWDDFDATPSTKNTDDNGSSSSSSDGYSDNETALMLLTPALSFDIDSSDTSSISTSSKQQRRKRGRKTARKHHGPAPYVIPSLSCEVSASSSQLDELIQDAHLAIASFLDIDSLRHFMGVNSKYRQILLSSDAHYLWMQHAQSKWQVTANGMTMAFSDTYHLPTAAGQFSETPINLPLLLGMTPTDLPTQVDDSLLEATKASAAHPHGRSWRSPSRLNMYNEDDDSGNTVSLIRYTGPIGAGDRCIRANHPFPRPQRKCLRNDSSIVPMMEAAHPTLFDLLCRGARAVSGRSMSEWRPFVSPHCDAATGSLQVTPRMVAYYEVAILDPKKSEQEDDNDNDDDDLPPPPMERAPNAACVAVGVATDSFRVHSRMPGWDNQSFGYHGDDGGIFHSSGGMVERFGPCFGAGDTIGCGIDYVAQGIFFTLNGEFIGYGWKGIDVEFLQNDLYPVVGIDTNAPIAVNFGNHPNRPFQFDLAEFTKKHEPLILPNYRFTGSDNNNNNNNSAPKPTYL